MILRRKYIYILIALVNSLVGISQILELRPFSPIERSESALRRFEEGLVLQSGKELERIEHHVGRFSLSDRAQYHKCVADIRSDNFLLADDCLLHFISERNNSPYLSLAIFSRAEIAFRQQEYEHATQLFKMSSRIALQDFKQRGDSSYVVLEHLSTYWRACSFALLGRYEEAQPVYIAATAFTQGTYSDDALYALGQIEESRLNYTKAIEYYARTVRLYSHGNVVVCSKIRHAQCLLFLRESSNAITQLESALNVLHEIESASISAITFEHQSYAESATVQIHYLRGEALNQLRQYEQALTEFNSILRDSTTNDELRYQCLLGSGWSSLCLSHWDDALQYYNAVIDSSSAEESHSQAMAKLYRCVALKNKGLRDEASRELSALSSSARYSQVSLALLELGQMQYEDSKFDAAKRSLERADRESPDIGTSVRISLLLGAVYTELQEWKRAIQCYQNAEIVSRKATISLVPQREQYIAEATMKRGVCYVQEFQYRDAISDLNAFTAANPEDPRIDEAVFWLAEAFYRADLMTNAEENYQKILSAFGASKRREEAFYGLGWTYFRTREFEKSNDVFSRMLREFPNSRFAPDVFVRKGDALYLTKKYLDAAKAYKEAYKINPKEEQGQYANFQIGQSLYRAKEYANATTQLKAFVKNFPKSLFADHALYTIAYIASYQERHDEAIATFESLISAYPQSELIPASMYYIANAYYSKGDYESAVLRFKTLMGLYQSHYYGIEALRGLQESLSALGRNDEAIEVGRDYIAANPNGTMREQINMKTIEIFLRKGDFPNAAKEYQDFLKKYPDSEYGAEALFLLAKSQLGMNEVESAQQSFAVLFAKYPKSDFAAQGLLQSALLSLERSDVSTADSVFDVVGKSFPKTELAARASYERARMTMTKGDSLRALELFHQSADMRLGEYSYQSIYSIAMYLRLNGQNDSARTYFKSISAYTDNPSLSAESLYRIGELYLSEKNYEKAAESFESLKATFDGIEDWYTLSLINLGECYERLLNITKAKEIYQTVIIIHPADDYGKTAQSRLKRLGK